MINIQKLKYQVILITEDGKQYDLTNVTQSAQWEENDGELSVRISLSLVNQKMKGKYLSDLAKPGTFLLIYADWGQKRIEAARGVVNDWAISFSSDTDTLDLTAYDEMYALQQSQDNAYFSAGTSTKSAVMKILEDWGVPVEKYEGPDVSHAKMVFKNECISDMVLKILNDAVSHGGETFVLRCTQGKVSILKRGSNEAIYHFDGGNASIAKETCSISNLVTRVKVVGKEDKEGRSPVEAILDGHTEFGIRQQIYARAQDDSLGAANQAAQKILDESGEPQRDIELEAPDVPEIRRGDKVHMKAGSLGGYFFVVSIQHDATERSMSMRLEPLPEENPAQEDEEDQQELNQGDSIILNGAVYIDSYGNGKGMTFSGYKGTITIKVDTSRPCPYHIDGIGWVYPESITKA